MIAVDWMKTGGKKKKEERKEREILEEQVDAITEDKLVQGQQQQQGESQVSQGKESPRTVFNWTTRRSRSRIGSLERVTFVDKATSSKFR